MEYSCRKKSLKCETQNGNDCSFYPPPKNTKKYKMMHCNKCVYCRNTESLTLERLSSTFNVKLQDGGQPPAPGAEHAIGTVRFMRKPSRLRGRR